MSDLLLHCGAEAIDRAELAGVLPLNGALGRFHNPVPYSEFVDLIDDSLRNAGYKITGESYGVLANGDRFFGLMQVEPAALVPDHRQLVDEDPALEGEYIGKADWATMIGLRGSYDQSLQRGLAMGSRVFVCDNLAFSGEVVMHTRQTTHIRQRLPGLVAQAMTQIGGMSKAQELRFGAYKDTPLEHRHGDAALVELVRREAINPSQLGKAIREWDEPSHEEHLDPIHGRTVWTLHNAVTEAIKPPADSGRANVLPAMGKTIPLTRFLDEVVGISF